MSNIRKALISLAFFLFFFSLISNVYAATPISDCTVIDTPGEYYLAGDIINDSAKVCIDIQANNVILDCQGHKIDGVSWTSLEAAINVTRSSATLTNVTVKNCFIKSWYYGIYLFYSGYNSITNITITNGDFGVYCSREQNDTISSVVISGVSSKGVYIEYSKFLVISNITVDGALDNINFLGVGGTIVRDSKITGALEYGFWGDVLGYSGVGGPNYFYNNLFNNTNNVYLLTVFTNYWNTTLTQGTNIVGGPYVGGNYWGSPDGTGFSDTCSDTDKDGICDSSYTLATNNIDYLPLAKYAPAPTLSVVFNYNTVDFGTVTPNTIAEAKSINYNVSITTNTNYKVSVNATDWSGATTIPANTLYFAVNDTLDKISFDTAKQLSTSVQLIATFPSSVTTNYHGFYFNVPLVPQGTYTATVTITYEVA